MPAAGGPGAVDPAAARREAVRLAAEAWEPFRVNRDRATIEAAAPAVVPLLEEAIRLDPGYGMAYRTLGWIRLRLGLYEEAVPLLRMAVSLPDRPGDAIPFLAQALEGAGWWTEAESELGPLAAAHPDFFLHRTLARAARETGRRAESLDRLETFLRREDVPASGLGLVTLLMTWCDEDGERARGRSAGRTWIDRNGWPTDRLFIRWFWSLSRSAGQEAFGRGDYAAAEAAYADAVACLGLRPDLAAEDMSTVDLDGRGLRGPSGDDSAFRLAMVRERAALGEVRPEITLRVLAVTVARVEADFVDLSGNPVSVSNGPSDEETLSRRGTCQAYVARVVEAWSGGRMGIEFDTLEFPGAVTSFKLNPYGLDPTGGREMRTALLDGLTPPPDFGAIARDYDIVVLYWNGEGVSSGLHGYVRGFPDGHGGDLSAPRGVLDLPLDLVAGYGGPRTMLHELFHVLESAAGIRPLHGYLPSNRDAFPAWTGSTEMDYYRWHFAATFPAVGWRNLSFRSRYPFSGP